MHVFVHTQVKTDHTRPTVPSEVYSEDRAKVGARWGKRREDRMDHVGRKDCLDLIMFQSVELVGNTPELDVGRCGGEEKLKKVKAWNVLYRQMGKRTEEKSQDGWS